MSPTVWRHQGSSPYSSYLAAIFSLAIRLKTDKEVTKEMNTCAAVDQNGTGILFYSVGRDYVKVSNSPRERY